MALVRGGLNGFSCRYGCMAVPLLNIGKVTERKLGNHMPGTALAPMIDVVSNTVGPKAPPPPRKMNHLGIPLPGSNDSGDWSHSNSPNNYIIDRRQRPAPLA